MTAFGSAIATIEAPAPEGGAGKALKIDRNDGDVFAGATVTVLGIPNDAGAQTISARVYSPMAGIPMVAKLEYLVESGTGDVPANETVAEGWQTLSWTFTNLEEPFFYSQFVILPNLGTSDSESYYFDNIDLVVAAFSADGAVESKSGGFKFPDGTVQMTAQFIGPRKYALGDRGPAGGFVFYVTTDGLHGLEAAEVDQSSGVDWGCDGTGIPGAEGTAIGTGARNTDEITPYGCPTTLIAAALAAEYVSPSGYFDWYLPAKDELNLMFQNLHVGGLGGFASGYYWSSSEDSGYAAWFQVFSNGFQDDGTKSDTNRVRAVRAF